MLVKWLASEATILIVKGSTPIIDLKQVLVVGVMTPNHATPAYSQGHTHANIGTIRETRRNVNPRAAFA
jgi:hypothetical protein